MVSKGRDVTPGLFTLRAVLPSRNSSQSCSVITVPSGRVAPTRELACANCWLVQLLASFRLAPLLSHPLGTTIAHRRMLTISFCRGRACRCAPTNRILTLRLFRSKIRMFSDLESKPQYPSPAGAYSSNTFTKGDNQHESCVSQPI
jgi:hypothetical protein